MAQQRTDEDRRQLRNFFRLVWLGGAAAVVSALSGILLLALDPGEGSAAEGALGLTAAVTGLLTAALAIAAAIYAQVKNLWRFVPTWGRIVAWVFITAVVIYSLVQAAL